MRIALILAVLAAAPALLAAGGAAAQERTSLPAAAGASLPGSGADGPAGPGGGAGADSARPLSLAEVVSSALSTHPALAGARARRDAAEAAAGEAKAAWLPTLSTSALVKRYQEPMVVAPLHGFDPLDPPTFDETLYQGHASLDYTLFDGGARRARVRAAENAAAAAGAGAEASADAVIAEAVSSYLAVLTAEEVMAAHRERVTALEQEHDRSQLMFGQGKAARVAVLRTDAALSRAHAEAVSAEQQLRLARRRLARVSGLADARVLDARLSPVVPAGEPSLDRDSLVAEALAQSPRVAQAEDRSAAARTGVSGARSAFFPRLALSGVYSAFGSPSIDLQPEWNAGVQVSYPVFTGGARGRAVDRARAEASAAASDAESVRRQVADAVDGALLAYRSARARAEALDAAVAQSAEVARIEALSLKSGAGVQTDYLQAEADLLSARASRSEARHAVLDAMVRLAQATGRLSVDWVERMTEEVER